MSDNDFALNLLLELLSLPGRSGQESAVQQVIIDHLQRAGVASSQIAIDDANKRSPNGGEAGNLVVDLPGDSSLPRRLLMAHTDTVPLCAGVQPIVDGDYIRSADPETALGGDDRAGTAVLLNTALTLLKEGRRHPPLTLFWAVQEEVGLLGARHADTSLWKKPALCFNWDGNDPFTLVMGATGDDHLSITIHGKASHAGVHPELGVSAIAIAARAIHLLTTGGWHGLIEKPDGRGTSNVGVISGGDATNVVTDRVTLLAEARSHDPKFRKQIVAEFRTAFETAVTQIGAADGSRGKIEFHVRDQYESFRLSDKEPCVLAAAAAIRSLGAEPQTRISNGGLDANWLTAHGYPTVTFGCGQEGIHTVEEKLRVSAYFDACRIAIMLACDV